MKNRRRRPGISLQKTAGCCVPALLLGTALATAAEISPFSSDGCSAFPDGTYFQHQLWLKCCIEHDLAYWQGGTSEDRRRADEALRDCVVEVGEPEIAELMLAGVRVGGSPYLPTRFRWGYGWRWPRLYGELSQEEQDAVSAASRNLPAEWAALLNEEN